MRRSALRLVPVALALTRPAMALECAAPPPISLTSPTSGDTTGKANDVEDYACAYSAFAGPGLKTGYSGGEDVYRFTIASSALVHFRLDTDVPGLGLLLLGACDAADCRAEGGCGADLGPGEYHLVVDGQGGAEGAYTLTPLVLPAAAGPLWTDCPVECGSGCDASPDVARAKSWHFNSSNYCGTGCDFALYAVVGCGTEMHLPLWDLESGKVAIHDVLNSRPVDLVATNEVPSNRPLDPVCAYTDAGTDVGWEDSGCSMIPCPTANCGGGSDCRSNDLMMDVSMLGTPELCGVYRIDHRDWGGWDWYAYANCSADRTEQFDLYRDVCAALVDWRPRPEVGIADVWLDTPDCGSTTRSGVIVLENIGCVDALGYEVHVVQAPPQLPDPLVLTADVPAGGTVAVPFVYTFAGPPTTLLARVDPDDRTAECSESLGVAVSCGQNRVLRREAVIAFACLAGCMTHPEAGGQVTLCDGDTLRLDGSGSTFDCRSGGTPEYRWEDTMGAAIGGCDWGPSPACTVPESYLPLGKSRFFLRTRCGGAAAACEQVQGMAAIVSSSALPVGLGSVLRLVHDGVAVRAVWSVVNSPSASFRLYRDSDPAVPPATRILLGEVARGVDTFVDIAPTGGPYHYQLVGVSCDGSSEGPY